MRSPTSISRVLAPLLAVAVVLVAGCFEERVDPGYEALVEEQSSQATPEAGSLGPGDKFSVRVYNEESLSGEYVVSSDGSINYPYIGRVTVDGMTCAELEEALTKGLADGYLREPSVSCSITEYNSKRIYVLGEVKEPGTFPFKSNLSIIEALALAGGTTERADTNGTKLTRVVNGVEVQVRVPMQEIVEGRKKNVRLLPGDVVFVPESAY